METIKFRVYEESSEEIIIITEDGGVACIRDAEPIDDTDTRIATSEYYQSRITNDTNTDNIFEELGEGTMYYNDWDETECADHLDERLITDALEWLVCATVGVEFVRDDTIWTNIF